jgi:Mor family transcriptional regulator
MADDDVPYRSTAVEFLGELGGVVAKLLRDRTELPADTANEIGTQAAALMARQWAGVQLYFPMGFVIDERDWQIYKEFTGDNITELARKYRVSEVWIYRIIKRMRQIDISRRQPDLFAGNDAGGTPGNG